MSGINAASLWEARALAAQTTGQTQAASSSNAPAADKMQFLNLLVAQLKNQDPLNPMDSKDFVAQLATFSSLEQLIDINKAVTKLAGGANSQTTDGANGNSTNRTSSV